MSVKSIIVEPVVHPAATSRMCPWAKWAYRFVTTGDLWPSCPDLRERRPSLCEQRRRCMAQIVKTRAGQPGLVQRPVPGLTDVERGDAGLAGEHEFIVARLQLEALAQGGVRGPDQRMSLPVLGLVQIDSSFARSICEKQARGSCWAHARWRCEARVRKQARRFAAPRRRRHSSSEKGPALAA
jgi:hypothetical protein